MSSSCYLKKETSSVRVDVFLVLPEEGNIKCSKYRAFIANTVLDVIHRPDVSETKFRLKTLATTPIGDRDYLFQLGPSVGYP
jgi:hypothetical protein